MEGDREIICNPFFASREFPSSETIVCFVIMPFSVPILEDIYRNSIKPLVEGLGITCIRGDDIFSVRSIMEDVWTAICKAQFIIGEFTGRNPNVLYEAGIAHTLGKPLICITQNVQDVPFDFRHIRHIVYENSPSGYRQLESRLERTIQVLLETSFVLLPHPVEPPGQEIINLRRLIVQERQSVTQIYTAIEQRIIQQYEVFHSTIQQLKEADNQLRQSYFGKINFCKIPEGVISVDYYSDDDRQVKTINREQVQSFSISKYPVTNEQYLDFVIDTGHPPPETWTSGTAPSEEEQHPVIGVSWVDVTFYCRWLSRISGKTIRLPSEAEWLAAAGYGLSKQKYPWGNDWKESKCNSRESGFGRPTPVTMFEGKGDSPYGCVDMLGNVWEWTTNRYQYEDNDGFSWRAVRGGANYSSLRNIGSTARLVAFPGHFLFVRDLGFRVVYGD